MNDETQTFDPELFMQQTVDQPLSTEPLLCPEGEYPAMLDDFESKAFSAINFTYKSGDRAGQPGVMHKFNLPCIIQDEAVKQLMERDKVTVYAQINLDFKDGKLEEGKGKNVQLGRLREAVNQNGPGAWSFSMLKGAGPLMVKVTHRNIAKEGEPERKIAEVTRFGRLS